MNKTQKIIIAITLLIIAFILIYPPVGRHIGGEGVKLILPNGRNLVFLFKPEHSINIPNLLAEIFAIACIGGALIIIFGLKR